MAAFMSGTRSYNFGGGGGGSGLGGSGRYAAEASRQTALRATAKPKATAASPEVMDLFAEAIKKYQPGGEFGKAETAMLAAAKKKFMASGAQSMVSAGLSGTSVPESMHAKFEESVGTPTRLGLEDTRTSRLSEMLMSKAGYLGGIQQQQTAADQRMSELRASLLSQGSGGGGGGVVSGGADSTGRAEISPTDIGAILAARKAKDAAARAQIDAPGFGAAQIPTGGTVKSGYYYPPTSSYTRNVPTLNL